jgi:WbqC-like protein family
MKLALMQPYFFPYVGYFQLIASVDRFVLFDDAQFIKGGWINRNRILKPQGGSQYVNLRISKHGSRAPIKDIRAAAGYDWKAFVLRQIEHYKQKAPFYEDVYDLLERCFELNDRNVARLNSHYLRVVCDYIGIPLQVDLSSALQLDYSGVAKTDDWAPTISAQLGAAEYVNPIGGAHLFEKSKFHQRNVKLTFLQTVLSEYDQRGSSFESALSIIDVLMFNTPGATKRMLYNATFEAL